MTLFVITLALTLAVPLQWAILAGAFLSLAAYVVASGAAAQLRRVVEDDEGWLVTDETPETLPIDEPLLLRYTGPDFFADIPMVAERLPQADPNAPGVLVLDVGALEAYSSTMLKGLGQYHAKLAAGGSGFVLTGVSDRARATLDRTGLLALLGPDNALPTGDHMTDPIVRAASGAATCSRSCERLELPPT